MKRQIIELAKRFLYRIPAELKNRQVKLLDSQFEELKQSLAKNYHVGWRARDQYTPEMYAEDIHAHTIERLEHGRRRIIPWLNHAKKLSGANVLEIGCGTGASTMAIAEQGANVVGIDIDKGALKVAEDRLRLANLKAELHEMNAIDIKAKLGHIKFDFIIFYATLEHMVISERIVALKIVWELLEKGGHLVLIETPNRLWFYDQHTSKLPFFNWLPDELAFYYSKFSRRNNFSGLYAELNEDNMMHFLRRGRGVSYHEFEVAIGTIDKLNVISSLDEFERTDVLRYSRAELRYLSFLRKVKKNIQKGFCYPNLDIIIRK